MGTFGKSGPKKWHFGQPNENFETTFTSPTLHKNDGTAFGFKRFPLLGGFWAYFQICLFSPCILHYEHKKIRSTISVHFSDQTKKAKLPEMAKLTRIQPVPVMGSNLCQNVSPYCTSSINMKKQVLQINCFLQMNNLVEVFSDMKMIDSKQNCPAVMWRDFESVWWGACF